jgi:sporulation protein YlmC with PRC-barrel domain
MNGATDPRLIKLSDTTLTLERPSDDIRHRKVLDADGNDVGKVDDLFIDEQERKVRFLLVQAGGFLGLGGEHFLIPIDAVTEDTADHIKLGHSREHIAGAPQYDPDLVDERHYAAVYGYYGYGPFWGPGYMYPGYPFPGQM